jgi:hypothetical protein
MIILMLMFMLLLLLLLLSLLMMVTDDDGDGDDDDDDDGEDDDSSESNSCKLCCETQSGLARDHWGQTVKLSQDSGFRPLKQDKLQLQLADASFCNVSSSRCPKNLSKSRAADHDHNLRTARMRMTPRGL